MAGRITAARPRGKGAPACRLAGRCQAGGGWPRGTSHCSPDPAGRWRMTARLPDPRRSYAVLIGNSTYASAELGDLPAVASSLTGLAEVLTDPALGAFPPGRCAVVADPASARTAYRALREYAALAEDTLLVYWAGHGAPGPRAELYLSVAD